MPSYTFWYKKEVNAKNLLDAMRAEKKCKLEFESIVENKTPKHESLESLIGFQVRDEEENF